MYVIPLTVKLYSRKRRPHVCPRPARLSLEVGFFWSELAADSSQVHGLMGSWDPRFTGSQVHELTGSRVPGFLDRACASFRKLDFIPCTT